MPVNINTAEIIKQVENGIAGIAKQSLKDYVTQAQKDGKAFLDSIETDLKNWTEMLAAGQLTPADFKDLVQGKNELLAMVALKQAGIAALQLDKFKGAVIDLLINTVLTVIKAL